MQHNPETPQTDAEQMRGAGERLFIDAHHHLWDLRACDYPWLMARGERRFFGDPTPIQRDYLLQDFLAESPRYRPQKSVHIQVGATTAHARRETAWLSALGDYPHAIVAAADLASANVESELEAQRAYPKLRGIRQILGRHAQEDSKHGSDRLIDNPAFARGLSALKERGLSFDLQLIPAQMQRVAALLAGIPELRVALCHCGSPWDQSPEGLAKWRSGLKSLASLPRVVCKISGLGMFNPDWTIDTLRPIVEMVIETFGPERVMLGSNFPVDKLYSDYASIWQAYEALLAPYTASERCRMRAGTASEFYQL
jgi:predicted TIM-barrel fold metal-dependent hydrolase